MKLQELPAGTKIYYHGDMANMPDVGTITKAYSDRWGDNLDIVLDDGRKMTVSPSHFSAEYLGNCMTKFVTLKAFDLFREKFLLIPDIDSNTEPRSECCDAPLIFTDICSKCREHCEKQGDV